jgi:shikimate dehydrogenase
VPWEDLARSVASSDLLVNATSIGWHGDELPFDGGMVEKLPDGAIVFDLTYRSTALLRLGEARGLRTVDGLPMLIHQGARAFELWTGQPAPVAVMTQSVRDEQARRA